jgi:predicted enzyme related to lactoylglutathione lyase
MFKNIGSVSIFVADQDRAKAFYTNTLGWELRQDQPLYPGAANRWVAVAPKGAETEAILYKADENWEHYVQVVGKSQAVTIDVGDVKTVYEELKQKGVKFNGEPEVQPWGTWVSMQDSEGNSLILVQG